MLLAMFKNTSLETSSGSAAPRLARYPVTGPESSLNRDAHAHSAPAFAASRVLSNVSLLGDKRLDHKVLGRQSSNGLPRTIGASSLVLNRGYLAFVVSAQEREITGMKEILKR